MRETNPTSFGQIKDSERQTLSSSLDLLHSDKRRNYSKEPFQVTGLNTTPDTGFLELQPRTEGDGDRREVRHHGPGITTPR